MLQDRIGVEISTLLEDPANATAQRIARDARQQLLSRASKPGAGAAAGGSIAMAHAASWIARAPVQIKLRLFCLPYAGGVSENVFGR